MKLFSIFYYFYRHVLSRQQNSTSHKAASTWNTWNTWNTYRYRTGQVPDRTVPDRTVPDLSESDSVAVGSASHGVFLFKWAQMDQKQNRSWLPPLELLSSALIGSNLGVPGRFCSRERRWNDCWWSLRLEELLFAGWVHTNDSQRFSVS